MGEKYDKEKIRNRIIDSAIIYSQELAGKYFLYVYDDKYIEILFKTENFGHLTGVVSFDKGKEFYRKAKNNKLSVSHFYFNNNHPIDVADKKTKKLSNLPDLTKSSVYIIEQLTSESKLFKIGINNLNITLGVIENRDPLTNSLINEFLIPTTFRIRGKADFEKSPNKYPVKFIFYKESAFQNYSILKYGNPEDTKALPEEILNKLDAVLKK